MHYRRAKVSGGTYFFTVNLADRKAVLLIEHIDLLRETTRIVRKRHPFDIVASAILPDHLHVLWRLPPGDADYPVRWSLIKSGFSRNLPQKESTRQSRTKKRERGIWQRRYWEHLIRDEMDLERHTAYIHYNPVKHGLVGRASQWPFSSIHRYIEKGWLSPDWAGGDIDGESYGE